MPLPKESHGVRPGYPPGTIVHVGPYVGVVEEAHTNIDGCEYGWSDRPRSCTYHANGTPFPIGYSHAWRPTYSVGWLDGADEEAGLKTAWWTADEWDSAELPPCAKLAKPWPAIAVEPTDSNCADARKPA